MNITIKDIEYNLERLLLMHHKGVRTKLDAANIINYDEAKVSTDIDHAIVVPTSDNKLLCVLKPAHPSNTMFILSKYILKQCLTTTQYAPTPVPFERYHPGNSYNRDNHNQRQRY